MNFISDCLVSRQLPRYNYIGRWQLISVLHNSTSWKCCCRKERHKDRSFKGREWLEDGWLRGPLWDLIITIIPHIRHPKNWQVAKRAYFSLCIFRAITCAIAFHRPRRLFPFAMVFSVSSFYLGIASPRCLPPRMTQGHLIFQDESNTDLSTSRLSLTGRQSAMIPESLRRPLPSPTFPQRLRTCASKIGGLQVQRKEENFIQVESRRQ